ncbi:MAG TPA: YceI family protein [Acidimicrobiales bacterium]|jgi:polyisoprenoid-binding protein YceI|nr:YceI family protein [Acidimicrobiales bacterium]
MTDAEPAADVPRRRGARPWRSKWRILAAVVVVLGGVAGFAWWKIHSWLDVPSRYKTVGYSVPSAPRLVAGNGETVYRIDPTRSQLGYEVSEKLVGATTGHAIGTTNGIAGDLALNPTNPAASRVGDIVANVEQFHSDQSLRDARIREDFLESATYPLATFHTTSISGLPARLEPGHTYHFQLHGTATVKKTTAPITWDATGRFANGRLTTTATTDTKLSTFGAGPISVAGLVSTSDAVRLTMRLTALDPSTNQIPTQIAAPAGAAEHGSGPSFHKTIQPILEASCASCHNTGKVGAEHWTLDTAGDASKVASGIGVVAKARYMPPWPASTKGVPLAHSLQLSQQQVDDLVAWGESGGHLDVPADTRIKPTPGAAGPAPRHDVVVRMAKAYEGSASIPNDYRCFVLDPHLTKSMYLTGYEFLGDQINEIHHAQVFKLPAAGRDQAAAREGQDGKPGWSCYGGPGVALGRGRGHRVVGQAGLIAGWVPGQLPVIYGHDSGVRLDPGDALVLQIHYHHEDIKPTPDRSGMALQLDPVSSRIRPITIVNPLAPVEIPCMPGTNAPLCNRDAALADDARLYGPIGAFAEPGLLGICGKTPEELTAGFDGVAHSSCDTKVPQSGTIIAVMGHMHTLGKSFRLTLDPGLPSQKILLDIPTWNFDWQMNYSLAQPLHVDAGQTVRMECTWDRSLDPNRPPKYIVFAEGTEDEMCFSTYALIPDSP